MIDFRYHLVSIVAIFLALSVGIVLGTTLLEDPVIKASESLANQLREGNNELRDQVDVLQRREAANDAFVTGDTSRLVQDALVGKSIVIVEAPGSAASVREAAQQVIEEAGGSVTGRITLAERYTDPAQAGFVDKLAVGAKAAETVFSVEDTAYDKAAEVLAGAILTSDSSQVGKEHPAGAGILDAFQRGGLLTVTDEPAKRADAALMIAPAEAYTGETAGEQAGRSSRWRSASTRRARAPCWPVRRPPPRPRRGHHRAPRGRGLHGEGLQRRHRRYALGTGRGGLRSLRATHRAGRPVRHRPRRLRHRAQRDADPHGRHHGRHGHLRRMTRWLVALFRALAGALAGAFLGAVAARAAYAAFTRRPPVG